MTLLEDEEVGKRGIVFIDFTDGEPDIQSLWKTPNLFSGLPLRLEALHLCHANVSWVIKTMESVLLLVAGSFVRVRTRSHFGK